MTLHRGVSEYVGIITTLRARKSGSSNADMGAKDVSLPFCREARIPFFFCARDVSCVINQIKLHMGFT